MKVIGYGDSVVDRYINKGIMYPGGNCLNFAVYAARLGMESSYLGVFGDDKEGRFIMGALDQMNVDYSQCRIEPGSVTERCDVSITEAGNRVFEGDDERENLSDIYELEEKDLEYLREFDLIHCSCFAEEETEIPKLSGMLGIVAYDFSEEEEFRTDEYLDRICPYIDFALFSCESMDEGACEAFAKKIEFFGVRYILLTRGPYGQIFYDGKDFYRGSAVLIEAVDTMGAGDSFFTAFLVKLLVSGWTKNIPPEKSSIREALDFAARFAAENCLTEGAFGYGRKF